VKIDEHRPLAPQLKDAFDPRTHGTTVPDLLCELARRQDKIYDGLMNLARRLTILDAHLEEAGIAPSYKNTKGSARGGGNIVGGSD
jgi:hypothetical protein